MFSRARRALGPYPGLFAIPGPKGFVTAGFVTRLPAAMIDVGLVLAITAKGGSYATAGTVVAIVPLVFGLASPAFGRGFDRYGQRRVLVPTVLAFSAAMLALMGAIAAGAPAWLLFLLAAAVGVVLPSGGPLIRARWTKLYQGTPKLRAAYGFESASTEVIYIAGPVLVTALATSISPEAGLGAVVACALAGGLALAAQRSTEPVPSGRAARRGVGPMRFPALRAIFLSRICIGGVLGAVPIVTVAYATAQHERGFSGLLLGVWGLASMVAGLAYGALGESSRLYRRLLITVALFAAGFIPLLFLNGVVSLTVFILIAGLAMAPVAITVMEVIQQLTPESMLVETLSWDGTALAFGMAAGAFLGGSAVRHIGIDHIYAVPVGFGMLALAAVIAGGRQIRAGCMPVGQHEAAPRIADQPDPAP